MYGVNLNHPSDLEEAVTYVAETIADVDFDTLVFRGFSGALVGPCVALRLNKKWALVRKPGDSTHSCHRIEGYVFGNYIIIDDFIDTGETVLWITRTVSEVYDTLRQQQESGMISPLNGFKKPECVGVALYEKAWCEKKTSYDKECAEHRISGLKILNEFIPDNNFLEQSASVGRMTFGKPIFFDMETDTSFRRKLVPPPDSVLFDYRNLIEEEAELAF